MADARKSRSMAKRALNAIDRLQARIDELERAAREPIAVVGMACRFPGNADNPETFWEVLNSGKDALTEPPGDRWRFEKHFDPRPGTPGKTYVKRAGYVHGIDQFDPRFFAISPREAVGIDPQHRLLLEVAFESLEHAGIAPGSLAGSRTGVFVGIGQDDYAQLRMRSAAVQDIDTYDGTGNLFCFGPGRIAHILGLRGPNMAIDTACSSSLVAIHEACQTLRNGGCEMALAGGVHLSITADVAVFLSQARVLAPDGRSKAFDAAADGFGRGEGCGVVVLKRYSDALANNDNILGLIRGTAVNHDGASSGLTVPNELAQVELIQSALANGAVAPEQVGYLEAHGTGTSLGDPIELHAAGDALCANREKDRPLLVGSVKTNIGHLEAAAGVAGLIKVLLAFHHKALPPHLHFHQPNPKVDWDRLPIEVTAQARAWSRGDAPRIAGISSFGFSGTNAHLLVEEPPVEAEIPGSDDGAVHVLGLSAKTDAALTDLVQRYADFLQRDTTSPALRDICATACVGRSHYSRRLAFLATTREELLGKLLRISRGEPAENVETGAQWAEANRLASAYADGDQQALIRHYDKQAFRRATLPTYPFQRGRYWVEDPPKIDHRQGDPQRHPLVHTTQCQESDHVVFESSPGVLSPRFLDDHQIFGSVVMPAAGFVEMALVAGSRVLESDQVQLTRMDFQRALVLANDTECRLRIPCQREQARQWSFSIDGVGDPALGDDSVTHARGRFDPDADGAKNTDLRALQSAFDESMDVAGAYREFAEKGVRFGPAFRCLQRLWRQGDEALAEISLADNEVGDMDGYLVHPALLDACFQAAAVALIDHDGTFVPVHIARLSLFRRPQGRVWCHARRREDSDASGAVVDLDLYDDAGDALAALKGLVLRKAGRDSFVAAADRVSNNQGDLFEIHWDAMTATRGVGEQSSGGWLIFADAGGVGGTVAQTLRERNHRVFTVRPDVNFKIHRNDDIGLDPKKAADYERLFAELGNAQDGPWKLIHLWALDVPGTCDHRSIHEAAIKGCGSVLGLLAAHRRLARPLIEGSWFVTRGAQSVTGSEPVRAHLATLWGLEKVIALEKPQWNSRCVDLDPDADEAEALAEEVLAAGPREYVAWRNGQRHVARLRPLENADADPVQCEADACYLIAGGTGALGQRVALWLVDKGARHIVLSGRGGPTAACEELAQTLQGQGVRVQIVSADIAVEQDVENLVASLREQGRPLRGVINAAGVIDDGALENLTFDRLWETMRPKAIGTLNLHRQTLHDTLDFLVCFSSSSAVVGSAGQGNYAAANAFMDAFAAHRRSTGLPAVSISWGAWKGTGMAAQMDERHQARWQARGLGSLSPQRGLEILGQLMQGSTDVCAIAMDWPRYLASTYDQVPAFFSELATSDDSYSGHGEKDTAELIQLADCSPGERVSRIADIVRSQVALTLGLSSTEEVESRVSLFDQGIDSLMATELTRRLEAKLGSRAGSTAVFNYPTVERLAEQLVCELFPGTAESEPSPDSEQGGDHPATAETSLESEIAEELAVLESLVGDIK